MDVLDLARLQFASTTIFHFIFVPISIGLSLLVAIMETMYVVKKNDKYKQMAQFWGKFLLINFAVGIVTGILQEFQFGMNWSEFSRFVGDIFGTPLAIEALLAFFLESTFIGLWVFGWDRLSRKVHLACIWLVSIGTMLSAFWILAANSFMQRPVGYAIRDGRAEMTDFAALLTNGQLIWEFPHTVSAAIATGAFLVAGISAWSLLRKRNVDFFRTSFKLSVIVAFVASIAIALFGHSQAQYLMDTQPMKMAASEGLWERSSDPAPWTVFAVIDPETRENRYEVKIPYLLSFLSYSRFSGSVPGMNELQAEYEQTYGPGNYIPPVRTTFWSFRVMVGSGVLMILLGMYGAFMALRKRWDKMPRWYLRAMIGAIFLPFIANTAGWIMTEIGRQPWTVFGLFKVEDSVSPNVTAGQIWFSLISFSAVYLILLALLVWLFIRTARKGPVSGEEPDRDSREHDFDPYGAYPEKGGGQVVAP
ncbi:MAG: cytochrome ubiquinol oxidase subunit I [Thermobacillus sp.]|jgi:cytochrome d ubiquinol oxidase subunit I|uniref:Cytochrome bd-type quinol oxidase, subunit 1 n=1 Tax=Thermobacillus composti (strain DSM 18247 / JCM 13945 / KWC4) TaxID=717605 RepID=L0EH12_THECK|nr:MULTISPECIES: cytochrome ubiquinol oxidase subunit I [Thermobacillus]AGA58976.1 cytochrome bd-type quinol oxidase, subunit 1 [Thermobacillus composti KWC4]REK52363.1 MAG: cytochrome ubiquinol oxidase subunit I [Thermobacillus sp.]